MVAVLAVVVLAVGTWLVVFALLATGSNVCGTIPYPVPNCQGDLYWFAGRAILSIACAVGAIVVARRARTAADVWKGGTVLLIAALVTSPLIG